MNADVPQIRNAATKVAQPHIVLVAIQLQRSVKNQVLMMNVKVSTRQLPSMIHLVIPVLNVLRTEIVRGQLLNA